MTAPAGEAAISKVARRETSGIECGVNRASEMRNEDAFFHISLHTHIVFSTKDRIPAITSEWRERLHSYLGGIVKGLGGTPLAFGGTSDHVHLLWVLSHRIVSIISFEI